MGYYYPVYPGVLARLFHRPQLDSLARDRRDTSPRPDWIHPRCLSFPPRQNENLTRKNNGSDPLLSPCSPLSLRAGPRALPPRGNLSCPAGRNVCTRWTAQMPFYFPIGKRAGTPRRGGPHTARFPFPFPLPLHEKSGAGAGAGTAASGRLVHLRATAYALSAITAYQGEPVGGSPPSPSAQCFHAGGRT